LEKALRKLERLEKRARKLSRSTKNVPLDEVLTPGFLREHTEFSNLAEMFEASGFKIGSQADLDKALGAGLDAFIARKCGFPNWGEMMKAAATDWVKWKLEV